MNVLKRTFFPFLTRVSSYLTLRIAGFSLLEVENLNWIKESYRLLKISKKPDRQEMWLVIRVTAIGMVAMGALGFLIKILVTSVVKPAG